MADRAIYFLGLGNNKAKYIMTRHNIGMDFVANLDREDSFILENFKNTRDYILRKYTYKDITFWSVRFKTYMNLSGSALKNFCNKENVDITQVCIIVDDFNLEFGRIRIRLKGSSGNHKGLQSIIDTFQTNNFARIRIGIGPVCGTAEDFVLQRFNQDELEKLPLIYKTFVSIIKTILDYDFETAMNKFN